MLVRDHMNCVYLWNGHPFTSLVKLKDYPEAVKVSPEVLAKGHRMMRPPFLACLCRKQHATVLTVQINHTF
jgi:hypothetical protein